MLLTTFTYMYMYICVHARSRARSMGVAKMANKNTLHVFVTMPLNSKHTKPFFLFLPNLPDSLGLQLA